MYISKCYMKEICHSFLFFCLLLSLAVRKDTTVIHEDPVYV